MKSLAISPAEVQQSSDNGGDNVLQPLFQRRSQAVSRDGVLTPESSENGSPRKERTINAVGLFDHQVSVSEYNDDSNASPTKRAKYRHLSHVVTPGPAYPLSAYQGWSPTLPRVTESAALQSLRTAFATHYQASDHPDFTYFELQDFSIYRPATSSHHPQELVTLDCLGQDRFSEFSFEGYLSFGTTKHYVQDVSFRVLTVDGYGDINATNLSRQLCIQSPLAENSGVWYRLGTPSRVYRRFHDPFLWLARFTKHFVDYLLDHSEDEITLAHFKTEFLAWLQRRYQDTGFHAWLEVAGLKDFRTTIAAHAHFLYKECYSIDDNNSKLCGHPIWKEAYFLTAIPEEKSTELRTVVTPYAYECFRRMYFGAMLDCRQVRNKSILKSITRRKKALNLTPLKPLSHDAPVIPPVIQDESPLRIQPGDVVCVRPELQQRGWTTTCTSDCWFAYVQSVRSCEDRTMLDVIWLYRPHDTTLGTAWYPFANELFMSDNCNCGKDALDSECVMSKVDVEWFVQDPYIQSGLFVRQKFRTVHDEDTYDFVTLSRDDFECQCEARVCIFRECRSKYCAGDTVLVREWSEATGEDRLQPAQIIDFDSLKERIRLRRFVRKTEALGYETNARPNELLCTSETFDKPPSKIIRKCNICCFSKEQIDSGNVTTPYNKDGTGDFFI